MIVRWLLRKLREARRRGPGSDPRPGQETASVGGGAGSGLAAHVRIVGAILAKDLVDALRDSRVIGALLAPVLIGVLYSFMIRDETPKPQARVAVVTASQTTLGAAIGQVADRAVRLSFRQVGDVAELRRLVAAKKVDIGLVLPPGFDAAVKGGSSPTLRVLLPPSPSYGGDYVAAVLDRALQALSRRGPPAQVARETVPLAARSSDLVMTRLGLRKFFVLWSIVFLLAMVAVVAVPTSITEEMQTRTLDSLLLIGFYVDIVVAKALFGILYAMVGVPIMLAITRVGPAAPLSFSLAMVLSAVSLVGMGLLLGSLLSNPAQLSTWGSLVSTPLIGAALAAGFTLPPAAEAVLFIFPTTHVTRLGVNGLAGFAIFPHAWTSYAVLLGWAVVVYGLLSWRLRRIEL